MTTLLSPLLSNASFFTLIMTLAQLRRSVRFIAVDEVTDGKV